MPQPNAGAYPYHHPGKYCADAGFPCFGAGPNAPTLAFALPAELRAGLDSALVLADLKDASTAGLRPSVAITLNDQPLGRMPASALVAGDDALKLELESGAYVDRVELELRYATAPASEVLFADGFEGDAMRFTAKAWRNPDSGRLGLSMPLVPIDPASPLHQCRD